MVPRGRKITRSPNGVPVPSLLVPKWQCPIFLQSTGWPAHHVLTANREGVIIIIFFLAIIMEEDRGPKPGGHCVAQLITDKLHAVIKPCGVIGIGNRLCIPIIVWTPFSFVGRHRSFHEFFYSPTDCFRNPIQ